MTTVSSSSPYQIYLASEPSPYIMSEEDFLEELSEEEKKTTLQKMYDKSFQLFESILPDKHKSLAPLTSLYVTVIRNEINTHPKITISVAAIVVISFTVFFYPQLLPETLECLSPYSFSMNLSALASKKMNDVSSTGRISNE